MECGKKWDFFCEYTFTISWVAEGAQNVPTSARFALQPKMYEKHFVTQTF